MVFRTGVRVGEPLLLWALKSADGIDRSLQVCCIHTDIRLEVFLARSMVGVEEDFSPPVADVDGEERLFILFVLAVVAVGMVSACLEGTSYSLIEYTVMVCGCSFC